MEFTSESLYIQSKTTARERIVGLDQCITALINTVLAACGTADVEEYMLNDGQTIIKTVYRDPNAVMATIERLERLKTYYQGKINNRAVRLLDAKNINR
jgi:hypothetical protein